MSIGEFINYPLTMKGYFMYDRVKWNNEMKCQNYLIFFMLLLLFLSGWDRPKLTGVKFEEIDTSKDPLQTPCVSLDPIIKEFKNGQFTITPVAEYKLSGMVVSKKSYSDDWDGKISPMDLAIVWGKLAEPEYGRYITFSQGSRWYHYKWKEGSSIEGSYVITHSGNHHIIPATENIRRAIKTVKNKDKVILEGLLVNIKGTYQGRTVFWNTSLSRNDTGNGSCELFYVLKVRIGTKVYE